MFSLQQLINQQAPDQFINKCLLNTISITDPLYAVALSEFVNENPNSILIVVDRGIDSQKTHDLVKTLGMENKVLFVEGPLNSTELLHYYNLADVIADQFVLGALGSIGWETFSCAKPLLAFINEEQYRLLYGQAPPMFNALGHDNVKKQLEILMDEDTRKKIGNQAREWITKYHSTELFLKKIINDVI